MIGNNLSQLILNIVRLDWLPPNFCQSFGSSLELALLNVVSRRLGENEETSGQDDSPEKLDGDWDTVRASIVTILGCVDNAIG